MIEWIALALALASAVVTAYNTFRTHGNTERAVDNTEAVKENTDAIVEQNKSAGGE